MADYNLSKRERDILDKYGYLLAARKRGKKHLTHIYS